MTLLPERGERTRRRVLIVAAAAMALALVNAALITPASQLIDDAFIFFRYADNFLAGHGLTWNPGGEHVEGYTSFLYLVVVTALRSLGTDPVRSVNVFNVGCYIVVVASSVPLVGRLGDRGASLLFVPLLVAVHTYFAQLARGGMEQMLLLVLVTWSIIAFLTAKTRLALVLSGTLFGLAALTRPEAMLDYVTCAVWAVAFGGRRDLATEGWRLAGLLLLVVPHTLLRHAYYGEWLPNTYYAKVHVESWAQLSRGLSACGVFLSSSRGALVQLAVAGWLIAPRSRARDLLVALMCVWLVYLLSLGLQDWNYYYSVPVDLFAIVVVGSSFGAVASVDALPRRVWALPAALALIAVETTYLYLHDSSLRAVLIVLTLVPLAAFAMKRWTTMWRSLAAFLVVASAWWQEPHQRYDVVWNNVAIGRKLKEISRPDETLAIGAAGAIPYYSGLVTFDTLGLNDKHIARVPVRDPAHLGFGHERGDGAYILSKKPTYLVPTPLRSMVPGPTAWWKWVDESFAEIFVTEEFQRDYHFEQVELEGGGYFKFYQRNR